MDSMRENVIKNNEIENLEESNDMLKTEYIKEDVKMYNETVTVTVDEPNIYILKNEKAKPLSMQENVIKNLN